MAFSGHPILDEIKKGFKLRPTKTVDKSKPIIYAEGEDAEEVAPTKRAPPSGILPPTAVTPSLAYTIPPPVKAGDSCIPVPSFAPGVIPPPPPMFSGGIPPPPPMGGIPPPPMMNGGPPPPPPIQRVKSPGPLNPALAKLGGKSTQEVDLGQLLKSIQGGIKLKKAVTNDKSGLYVDDDMREKSVTLVDPVPAPTPERGRSPVPPRPRSALGIDSEDERYSTPIGREYRTPEPRDDSPEQVIGGRRPIVMYQKGQKPIKPDVGFDENSLKVTQDQISQEIRKGLVASKMGAMAKLMGFTEEGYATSLEKETPIESRFVTDQLQGGTLPRASFKPSPLRSSFLEVNNNKDADGNPKPKPVSKWAPVDTNYGLRRASNNNTPLEKTELALNDPHKDRANSVHTERRDRSYLDEPRYSNDRARTQSPTPTNNHVREIEVEEEGEAEPVVTKKEESKSRLNGRRIPDPISVKTDFSKTKPEIQETPPTPAKKQTYNYGRQRATSPSGENSTMASPLSSLSSTSPSVSPGSSSPDQAPRRRIIGAGDRFDKAREKFGTAATETSPTMPTPKPYFLKSGLSSTNSNKTPEPSTDKETTPVANGTSSTKKPVSKTTKEPASEKASAAEAKGAAAVAKAGAKKVVRKKSETAASAPTATTTATDKPPTSTTTSTTAKKPLTSTSSTKKPEEYATNGEKPESAAPKPKRTLKKTMSKDGTVKSKAAAGTGSASSATSSMREAQKNAAKFDDEVEAVKRAVKEAAAARQRQYSVPSYHSPLSTVSSYSSFTHSPTRTTTYHSPHSSGLTSLTSSPLSRRRIIDVPISAPWHSTSTITTKGRSHSETMSGLNRRLDSPLFDFSFSPESMRRNYRFDINLTNDVPISMSHR